MGPVTSAGAIAQALAETMAGCALTQLERPGAPVVFGNFLSSTALRSGSPTFGTPEPALGSLVVGQLARRLKLPLRCSGAFTSSKIPDGQAMQESTMSMLAAVQCGANFILHSAGWLEGGLTMGYEKFVMDADFCAALHVWMRGLPLDDNAFALDAFREVGPRQAFLRRRPHARQLRDRVLGECGRRQQFLRAMARRGDEGRAHARRRALQAAPRRIRAAEARPRGRRGATRFRQPPEGGAAGPVALANRRRDVLPSR